MNPLLLAGGFAAICLVLPNRMLVLMSVLGVMLADTALVPSQAIYFSRFVPSGVLALRTLQRLLARGSITSYLVVRAWLPFFLLSFISIAYSVDRGLSTQRLISAIFILVGFGIGIPLFFPRTRDHRRLVQLIGLLLGSAVLYSLYLTTQGESGFGSAVAGRASGVFKNPNTLGLMAMQAAFLVCYLWQSERRPLRRRLLYSGLIIIVGMLLITGSRASAVGLAAGGFVFIRLRARLEGRTLKYLSRLAFLGMVAVMATETLFPDVLDTLLRTETSSRIILWKRAWILAQDNLVFGVGFSASDEVFARDAIYLKSTLVFISGPHSSLMRLLVDLGLVGVALAAWAFFQILSRAWRYMPYFEDPMLGAFVFSAIVASLTNSLFESWLFGFGSAPTVPLWLLLALLSYQTELARQRLLSRYRNQAGLVLAPATRSLAG